MSGMVVAATAARAQAPTSPGLGANAPVEQRVEALLARLTSDEKIGLLGGIDGFDVPGLARLGIPRLGTADSPFGVRARGPSTVYAGGIALAASWDPALAERVGTQLGRDARARGADAGTFTVRVGNSSLDLPLTASLVLPRTATRGVAAR